MFFLEIQKCMIFFFSHLVSVFYLFSTSLALIGERGGWGWDGIQLVNSQSYDSPLHATEGAFHFDGSLKSFQVSVWLLPCLSLAA